jgi:hypothetical protein
MHAAPFQPVEIGKVGERKQKDISLYFVALLQKYKIFIVISDSVRKLSGVEKFLIRLYFIFSGQPIYHLALDFIIYSKIEI